MKQNLLKFLLLLCALVVGSANVRALDKWVRTSLADLTETDVFIIVGTTSDGASYGMSNDGGTGSAPRTADVTVVGDEITKGATNDGIKWNISGNATDGYVFYPNGSSDTWLYCTNTNNGVRVGTNANKLFTVTEQGYLYNEGTSRYIGIYNKQDWRCYTSINDNIKNETFSFFKKVKDDTPETKVATPVITGEEYFYPSTEITITCDTENADILVVLSDGETSPTTLIYTEPFTITKTMIVRARARKEGLEDSDEAVMTFNLVEPVNNIEGIHHSANHDYVNLTDAMITYKNGKYAYLEDYSGAILLYDCAGDLEAGDKLNGIMHIKDYTVYNNLPEIKAFEMMEGYTKTSGNEVTPTEITLQQLLIPDESDPYERKLSKYIKIVDAEVTSAFANKNCTITQGDYSIILRDQNSTATLTSTVGNIVTVTGHVAIFNTTKQIAVYEQSQIEVAPAPTIPTIAETRVKTLNTVVNTQGIVTSCAVEGTKATAYIQDETAAICVYAEAEMAELLAPGNKINVEGTLKSWKGLLQIQEPTVTVVSSGNSVAPQVMTIDEIIADFESNNAYQSMLVKIVGATVVGKYETNASIQQDVRSMTVLNLPETLAYDVDDRLTLVGNISTNGTACIANPTNIEVIPAGTIASGDFTWDLTKNLYEVSEDGNIVTWSSLFATMVNSSENGGTKANNYLGGDRNNRTSSRFYKNNILTITPVVGNVITKIEFTATTDDYATALANSEWTNATATVDGKLVTVIPTDGYAVVSAVIGGTCGFTGVTVYYQQVEVEFVTVKVSEAGYATYVTPKPVSFTGVKAYVVSAIASPSVILTEVTEAPANTPVIIKAEEGTYNLLVKEKAASVGTNLLKVSDGTIVGHVGIFVLAKPEGEEVGFYAVKKGTVITEGKAYIEYVNTAGVKALTFLFADQADGIRTLSNSPLKDENIYNLAGQRIQKMQKGINIVGGKKIVVK